MYPSLCRAISYKKQYKKQSKVFLCYLDGNIIGWGFAVVRRNSQSHRMFSDIHVYVAGNFRRQGHGKRIVSAMLKWIGADTKAKSIVTYSHDLASAMVYASCGLMPGANTLKMCDKKICYEYEPDDDDEVSYERTLRGM
jgi:hypothetical protein